MNLEADMAGVGHPIELEVGNWDSVDPSLIVIIQHANPKRVPLIHLEGP